MSWSGQRPGAASFPPPQYPNGHVKKKGNPIITRYPPPPGYRGPAQNHNQFNAQAQIHFGRPAPTFPGYQAVPNNVPYQHHAFPQQPQSQSPTSYWQQQSPLIQGSPQTYPPSSFYNGPANHAFPGSTSYTQHNYNHPRARPPHSTHQNQSKPHLRYPDGGINHFVAPLGATVPYSASASLQQIIPTTNTNATEKVELFLGWDDWEFDFDGAIWPKSNEPVDPNLSLGVILWHPAKQVTRALPATFAEAEAEALMPVPEGLGNGESVSIYFTAENSHEAFLDVRQTDEWDSIRTDPIFVEFSDCGMAQNLITLEECIAQRERPDDWRSHPGDDDDEEMPDAAYSVMDHLELALSCADEPSEQTFGKQEKRRFVPQSQEDILAALGVTGVPKPPSCTTSPSAPVSAFNWHDIEPPLEGSGYFVNSTGALSSTIQSARQDLTFDGLASSGPSQVTESLMAEPTLLRRFSSSYRKRSLEDTEAEGTEVTQDDYTRRKRRSQADTAYSRR